MKVALFVAAALAAGGYSFAANAGQMDAGSIVKRVSSAKDGPTAPKASGRNLKGAKAVKASVPAKAKPAKQTDRVARKVGKSNTVATKSRAGKRQRVIIDTTRTASIGELASFARGAKAVKSGAGGIKIAASASAFNPIITRYAAKYGVPVTLAHAVIRVESNYRPSAYGSAGEIGLMQIKPATARMLGYTGSAKGLYDPDTNIRFGMKYLSMAHDLGGGDTCGTILRYNAGHAAKRMNPVSAAYCVKVKQHMAGL